LYSTLQNGIIGFRNDLFNQSKYIYEFLNCIKNDLIDPLMILMNQQNTEGKKLNQDINKNEKEFKESIEKMEKVKLNIIKNFKLR
jgi:hypothetical protein